MTTEEGYGGAYTGAQIDQAIGKALSGSSGGANDAYSTEETRIGTWIDGKPLYRKVYKLKGIVLAGGEEYLIERKSELNIDKATKCYWNGTYTDEGDFNISRFEGELSIINDEIRIVNTFTSGAYEFQAEAFIEYTKTTDRSSKTILTSKVDLPQSAALPSQDTELDSPVTVSPPYSVTFASQ